MNGRRNYGNPCGVARSLDVVGERWALLVVRDLLLGPKRFNDLLAGLPGVSPNVLSQRLRDLADHGVVHRRELGAPARVHYYELTEWGRELEPLLLQLGRWGNQAPHPVEGELGVDSIMLSIKAAFDAVRADELRGTYEFRIDADTFVAEVADASLRIYRGTAEHPDAVLATGIETLRAVCDGRRSLDDAARTADLRLDSDRAEATVHLSELLMAPFSPQTS
ncbi:helix-turn-helix transcriptional regulator [Streptomyces sp. NBC_01224]|uniref:winged helix-turn-helix transcriptional regulator n=1 Tax=Streptomyces sp. NBC_01224 TaxID=2903783 RepID=UPI002E1267E7|nr:helix-turn-helix transcriptional regulator [Streptomyces sp. NBC_01224]